MTSVPTLAQRELARRQRRKPPRHPRVRDLDRAQFLYGFLKLALPDDLVARVANGTVAIGEVGEAVPDIFATPVTDGQYVIQVNSGMRDFQYALARTMSGLHRRIGHDEDAVRGVGEAIVLLEQVLRRWARYIKWYWLLRTPRVQPPSFPISTSTQNWIDTIVTMGELFLLSHELGHIALWTRAVEPLSDSEEVEADRYGLQFLLRAGPLYWQPRLIFAAPVIGIQVFAALERLGVRRAERYPPQAIRIDLLREQVKSACPSKYYYYEISTLLVAYQDMLDSLVNRIESSQPAVLPDAERLLIRMLAELQAVAENTLRVTQFINDIERYATANPGAIREAATELVTEYLAFPPPPDSYLDTGLKEDMATKLFEVIAGLSPQVRDFFPVQVLPPWGAAVKRK